MKTHVLSALTSHTYVYAQVRDHMNATMTQQNFVSASELSRLANVPVQRLLRGIKAGQVKPDSAVMDGRLFLFRSDRANEVRAQLLGE